MNVSDNIDKLTDNLFRHESGKMVAVLTKIFGAEHLDLAEDVVQDTFISAIGNWKLKGIPENPSGWLFRSARNKAIDVIRRNRFTQQFDFNDPERELLKSEYTLSTVMDSFWQEEAIKDDLLKMMFACCHPGINMESQIALVLKTLCGFSTAEIARAFLSSEETVTKRLYRTREFFRAQKTKPAFPPVSQLKDRTGAVLKTIYLIFNEGYNSTHTDEFIRKDLIDQSMYLCRLLCENSHTTSPEVMAALALMCLHAARIDSRISEEGDILLLAEQDRTKWDKELIMMGNHYLNLSATGNELSSYHVEAGIAYEHCMAESLQHTNWERILQYYDWLVMLHPDSPIVMLNRMTVVFKIKGAEKTLEEIQSSPFLPEWEKHYLYYSLLGEIHAGTDKTKAISFFEKSKTLTKSSAEKRLLQKKINAIA